MKRSAPKEVILKEGEAPKGFFILADGEVSVTTDSDSKVVTLSASSNDNFFGELALIERIPVSATVTAVKDSLLLHVSPTAFQNFLQMVTPEVRRDIAKTIRARAKSMLSKQVSDLVDPSNVALGERVEVGLCRGQTQDAMHCPVTRKRKSVKSSYATLSKSCV